MTNIEMLNIMMDWAEERFGSNEAKVATLPQLALTMIEVQDTLLPIEKEALQRYLINKSN